MIIIPHIGIDHKEKSAWVVVRGSSIPFYWSEPHQFLAGLSLAFTRAFKNREVSFARLAELIKYDEDWLKDLERSELVQHIDETRTRLGLDRDSSVNSHYSSLCTTLYMICRSAHPETIVETGVGAGTSSAFILQALHDNHKGCLYSIERVKDGLTGILVNEELRDRWNLSIGKSVNVLPEILKDREIDIFLHDSEHTNRNMIFEYDTAWAKIRSGGYLLSDDITANFSFYRFSRRSSKIAESEINATMGDLGIMRKCGRY